MSAPQISKAAVELIVSEEVSSKTTYENKYRRPEWPGVNSGVTIGVGYDVGQNTPEQVRHDWSGIIADSMVEALCKTCGVTGPNAAPLARSLRSVVDVPWDAAVTVFERKTLPRYIALTAGALENEDELNGDEFGALVSLVFNRGATFSKVGDRYREMNAIRQHMAARRFDLIPNELRRMKRIWIGQGVDGVINRREHEAQLFERGLRAASAGLNTVPHEPQSPPIAPASPPATAPQPAPSIFAQSKFWETLTKIFGRG